jgi:hypothetical protein
MDYYQRPEWSYSQMKVILDSGIDYAVANKRGMLPGPKSPAIDLGQLAHMMILGGKDQFALSEFSDYRTKAAREWRDSQEEQGKIVISQSQWKDIEQIVTNIEKHPRFKDYLGKGKKAYHELELFATADGVKLRGKADYLHITENGGLIITDLKTTAQFDSWARKAYYSHYDLQAAVYTLIGSASTHTSSDFTNYYFCVAETIPPYRVQFMHASLEFIESGERKLRKCIDAINEFGDKEPNFLINEVTELGDYSL